MRESGSMRARFLEFHRENPQVYRQIKDMCQNLWDRGWRHYGMHTVMHALRYRFDLETGGGGDPKKTRKEDL